MKKIIIYDYDMNILFEQIKAIIDKNVPLISNLSNVASLLAKLDNINWAGFYLANEDYLYLGPFFGEPACTIIPFSKGVCGACYQERKTLIVPNVNEFKGHIACSSLSKSEIVTPIIKEDKVVALIDIDAPIFDRFHQEDKEFLEKIAKLIEELF